MVIIVQKYKTFKVIRVAGLKDKMDVNYFHLFVEKD